MEEGIVVGGGCTLLRLASKVDAIKETLDNEEEKVCSLVMSWAFIVAGEEVANFILFKYFGVLGFGC